MIRHENPEEEEALRKIEASKKCPTNRPGVAISKMGGMEMKAPATERKEKPEKTYAVKIMSK